MSHRRGAWASGHAPWDGRCCSSGQRAEDVVEGCSTPTYHSLVSHAWTNLRPSYRKGWSTSRQFGHPPRRQGCHCWPKGTIHSDNSQFIVTGNQKQCVVILKWSCVTCNTKLLDQQTKYKQYPLPFVCFYLSGAHTSSWFSLSSSSSAFLSNPMCNQYGFWHRFETAAAKNFPLLPITVPQPLLVPGAVLGVDCLYFSIFKSVSNYVLATGCI